MRNFLISVLAVTMLCGCGESNYKCDSDEAAWGQVWIGLNISDEEKELLKSEFEKIAKIETQLLKIDKNDKYSICQNRFVFDFTANNQNEIKEKCIAFFILQGINYYQNFEAAKQEGLRLYERDINKNGKADDEYEIKAYEVMTGGGKTYGKWLQYKAYDNGQGQMIIQNLR